MRVLVTMTLVFGCMTALPAQVIDVLRFEEVMAEVKAKRAAQGNKVDPADAEKLEKALDRREERREDARELLRNRNQARANRFALGATLPVPAHTRPMHFAGMGVTPSPPGNRFLTGGGGGGGSAFGGLLARTFVAPASWQNGLSVMLIPDVGADSASPKRAYLEAMGHEVFVPNVPTADFGLAVASAEAATAEVNPNVIIGHGRGGAIAMAMQSGDTPLVLMAPAWREYGVPGQVKSNSVILHAVNDKVIPVDNSRMLATESALPRGSILTLGDDHELNSPQVLAVMLNACYRLVQ